MIALDSVIALPNGFVTLDNLNDSQYIKSPTGKAWLNHVEYGVMKAVVISTNSYDLISSFAQKVLTIDGAKNARDIELGDMVLTASGEEAVTIKVFLTELQKMAGLHTKKQQFFCNGFILEG